MLTIYDTEIDNDVLKYNLTKILNQIYRLLPIREEGSDWEKPLQTLIIEVAGLNGLFKNQGELFLTLLSKLQGMLELKMEDDFFSYRRTVFECCNILDKMKQNI